MNVPNTLTLLRIFFVPLLVAALVSEDLRVEIGPLLINNHWLALLIFLMAAMTDLLDGYLARRWNQITTVGMLLDPVADKLLVSAALISLVHIHSVPAWMAVLIIGREFAVSGLRSIAAAEGYTIAASDLAKTKTATQVLAIALVMAAREAPGLEKWAQVALWGTMLFALVSAGDYFLKFWSRLDESIKARRRTELLQLEKERQKAAMRAAVAPKGKTRGR